eukprot:COSAG01_NODE_2023_length_8616_cov_89.751673_11_plen_58_part_00
MWREMTELMAAGRQDGQVTRQLVSAVAVRVRMRIRLGGGRALVRARRRGRRDVAGPR